MGTRNLFTITHENKVKLAKYNQWDGYLDGQGKDLAGFIVNELDFEKLKLGLNEVVFIGEDEFSEKIELYSAERFEVSHTFPLCSRDIGILPTLLAIQNLSFNIEKSEFIDGTFIRSTLEHTVKKENLITVNRIDFMDDGLFCEYRYDFNLDNNVISVFKSGKEKCDKLVFKCDVLEYPETLEKFIAKEK